MTLAILIFLYLYCMVMWGFYSVKMAIRRGPISTIGSIYVFFINSILFPISITLAALFEQWD